MDVELPYIYFQSLQVSKTFVHIQLRVFANTVSVNDFDFNYLRFDGGKYGNDELRKLLNNTNHPQAELIHEKAEAVLQKKYRGYDNQTELSGLSPERLSTKLNLYPKGAVLDPAFVNFLAEQLKSQKLYINCNNHNESCQMLKIDLNADGLDEILLFNLYQGRVFGLENGIWHLIGNLSGSNMNKLSGDSLTQILEEQDVKALPPKWSDIQLGNDRYSVSSIQ